MDTNNIIGQQDVLDWLIGLEQANRLPHAMLLTGPQGVGKMAVAIEFAKYLLGKNDPFGNARLMVKKGTHPDLHYSFPVIRPKNTPSEKKMESDDYKAEWMDMIQRSPYFGLSDWMAMMGAENQQAEIGVGESNALVRRSSLKSSQGGYMVNIVWQTERMNGECANKLLKLIEEPPEKTVFMLLAEQPEQIIETIISRTQPITVKPLPAETIANALMAERSLDEDIAMKVARAAKGSWLHALQIISGESERMEFFAQYYQLMNTAYHKNVAGMKDWSRLIYGWGREKQKRFLEYAVMITRELFMYNLHEPELCYMTPKEEVFAKKFSPFVNEKNIIIFNNLYNTAIRDISRNGNANMVLFDMALKVIALLQRK
ncbi:MAG: DNA polymerase III subunit delta [Bacteroidaceae bacterium]|nr:DNA polymerase III subunit delta [Bacteroidaceae bacterium]